MNSKKYKYQYIVTPQSLQSSREAPFQHHKNHPNNYLESQNSRINQNLKDSVSTRQYTNTQAKSSQNLYLYKLESRVLELQKKQEHQRFQIEALMEETQLYTKTCQQQKQQLASYNVELLRQEYEEQITELIEEKEKISQLIINLTEEYRMMELEEEEKLVLLKKSNAEMASKIEEALNLKEHMLASIKEKDRQHQTCEEKISQQDERVDQLRNIERKLFIAIRQMQHMEE